MNRFNPIRGENLAREIFEIESDDAIRASVNCRREDMAIIRVGEFENRDQRFLAGDERIGHGNRSRPCALVPLLLA